MLANMVLDTLVNQHMSLGVADLAEALKTVRVVTFEHGDSFAGLLGE